jgi:hypothetical protein
MLHLSDLDVILKDDTTLRAYVTTRGDFMTVNAQRSCESSQQGSDYLESLAEALARRGLRTRLMMPQGRIPSLHVVNPAASVLAEDIYAGRGQDGTWWFWWSWAERIGESDDLEAAATRIARVLAPHE